MTRRARNRLTLRPRESSHEPARVADAANELRGSGGGCRLGENVGRRGGGGGAGDGGRLLHAARPVATRLPDRLHAVAGAQPWLSGAADGATSVRRPVGIVDPAHLGGG